MSNRSLVLVVVAVLILVAAAVAMHRPRGHAAGSPSALHGGR